MKFPKINYGSFNYVIKIYIPTFKLPYNTLNYQWELEVASGLVNFDVLLFIFSIILRTYVKHVSSDKESCLLLWG